MEKWLILFAFIIVLIIVILLIVMDKKKVKPIDLEAVEEQKPSELEQVIAAMESSDVRPLTTFEQEQEENAIISYQELVEAVKKKKGLEMASNTEPSQPPVQPVVEAIEQVSEPTEKIENQEEVKKFKNSEFISPVFGKTNTDNDHFLKELKDFRKNL